MVLKFIDFNDGLVRQVGYAAVTYRLPIECHTDNIFTYDGVIVSASNPMFTFGGGLDYHIAQRYPQECLQKHQHAMQGNNKNERIGNVIFTITVNKYLKATKQLVDRSIRFSLKNTKPEETLLLSGLGTGIGGLSESIFIELLIKNLQEVYDR